MEKKARFRAEKVTFFSMSGVFSEAHVPGKHQIEFYFAAWGRRNSARRAGLENCPPGAGNWVEAACSSGKAGKKKSLTRMGKGFMERVTRLELATSTLARWRSTR